MTFGAYSEVELVKSIIQDREINLRGLRRLETWTDKIKFCLKIFHIMILYNTSTHLIKR